MPANNGARPLSLGGHSTQWPPWVAEEREDAALPVVAALEPRPNPLPLVPPADPPAPLPLAPLVDPAAALPPVPAPLVVAVVLVVVAVPAAVVDVSFVVAMPTPLVVEFVVSAKAGARPAKTRSKASPVVRLRLEAITTSKLRRVAS
jgi:hypothetical protein